MPSFDLEQAHRYFAPLGLELINETKRKYIAPGAGMSPKFSDEDKHKVSTGSAVWKWHSGQLTTRGDPVGTPAFNVADADKFFSVECFNKTWDLIDKSSRTDDDNSEMAALSLTSLWHWTRRPDCTPKNLSIGHWQLSRVMALIGNAELARYHGTQSLAQAANEAPFYQGFAHEALARAAMIAKDAPEMAKRLQTAREFAAQVTDSADREVLEKDLATIRIQ